MTPTTTNAFGPLLLVLGLCLSPGSIAEAGEAIPPERIEAIGIENLYRLSTKLYSGGEPKGPDGFRTLRELGIRTILSVDGAMPDVEAAREQGLRYVHIPVGYDGIPREQVVRIVQAARLLPGPLFVHCHHGKHRGPAAAAICVRTGEDWTTEEAVGWLEQAGTSSDYRGLFRAVTTFVPPTVEERTRAGSEFPERAEVPGLVESMVRIDGLYDRLQTSRAAGFRTPADHPDIDPPHEALQLAEQFREAARVGDLEQDPGDIDGRAVMLWRSLENAARLAKDLEHALRGEGEGPTDADRGRAEDILSKLGARCVGCHATFRDR